MRKVVFYGLAIISSFLALMSDWQLSITAILFMLFILVSYENNR